MMSLIDYALHFGLPGLVLGIISVWYLTKKCDYDKRVKYLKIMSYIYALPYALDMMFFGPRSYLSVVIYGSVGLLGIMLSVLSLKNKHWISAVLYLAPIVITISVMTVLGP